MPAPGESITVRPLYFLMIEDDDDHAALFLHILRQHHPGHTALHLKDGHAAMAYLQELATTPEKQRPDVILLDLNLPNVDGLDVLAFAKQHEALRALPIVVLTTSSDATNRTDAYQSYANSYIVKPVSFEKFEAMVVELSTYWGGWNQGV